MVMLTLHLQVLLQRSSCMAQEARQELTWEPYSSVVYGTRSIIGFYRGFISFFSTKSGRQIALLMRCWSFQLVTLPCPKCFGSWTIKNSESQIETKHQHASDVDWACAIFSTITLSSNKKHVEIVSYCTFTLRIVETVLFHYQVLGLPSWLMPSAKA